MHWSPAKLFKKNIFNNDFNKKLNKYVHNSSKGHGFTNQGTKYNSKNILR